MMPSYRESITSESAWDVVNYVRKLQGNPEPPSETATQESETTQTSEEPDTAQEDNSAEESTE